LFQEGISSTPEVTIERIPGTSATTTITPVMSSVKVNGSSKNFFQENGNSSRKRNAGKHLVEEVEECKIKVNLKLVNSTKV
jgi:hypothetical protein